MGNISWERLWWITDTEDSRCISCIPAPQFEVPWGIPFADSVHGVTVLSSALVEYMQVLGRVSKVLIMLLMSTSDVPFHCNISLETYLKTTGRWSWRGKTKIQ